MLPHIRKPDLRKIIVMVVFLGLTYQAGACPCGCLEHNVWVQMLGWGDDPHQHAGVPSSGADVERATQVASHHDHDCEGLPPSLYVSSMERMLRPGERTSELAMAAEAVAGDFCPELIRRCDDRGPPGSFAPGAQRARLQVFLL